MCIRDRLTVGKNNIKFIPTVSYGEDFLFNLEYLKYCNGAIETNEKLYNYILQNPDSLEAKYKSDLFENQTMLYKAAKQAVSYTHLPGNSGKWVCASI